MSQNRKECTVIQSENSELFQASHCVLSVRSDVRFDMFATNISNTRKHPCQYREAYKVPHHTVWESQVLYGLLLFYTLLSNLHPHLELVLSFKLCTICWDLKKRPPTALLRLNALVCLIKYNLCHNLSHRIKTQTPLYKIEDVRDSYWK